MVSGLNYLSVSFLCHFLTSIRKFWLEKNKKNRGPIRRNPGLQIPSDWSPIWHCSTCASTDGYQIFRQNRNDCWVILFINANLPPDIRVKRENLMISALIPGPKAPKNFNSFLQPLVDELKKLQGNVWLYNNYFVYVLKILVVIKENHVFIFNFSLSMIKIIFHN